MMHCDCICVAPAGSASHINEKISLEIDLVRALGSSYQPSATPAMMAARTLSAGTPTTDVDWAPNKAAADDENLPSGSLAMAAVPSSGTNVEESLASNSKSAVALMELLSIISESDSLPLPIKVALSTCSVVFDFNRSFGAIVDGKFITINNHGGGK